MSVLVVGLSHASAPVSTLERAVVSGDAQTKLLQDVFSSENVAGALVLSTCNRIEIYAEVDRFHGGVAAICELLARHSALPLGELTGSAYLHYEDRAVQHLLTVACGLESMVVGESQILGQVRHAVKTARQHGTLSHELSDVSRLALRAGRRAHAETGIDAAGQSLVSLGLGLGASACGSQPGLTGLSVLVIGAGSMSSLAVATAVRQGASRVVIANRTPGRAERLAARYGAGTTSLTDLPAAVAAADLVVASTGAAGHVLTKAAVSQALRMRAEAAASGGRPGRGQLALVDLALPRDIEAAAGALPGVRLTDLETIGAASGRHAPGAARLAALASESDVTAVRRIVAEELAGYLQAQRAESVAPTVVALRAKAATVVESELARLERRLGELDARTRREIAQTMGRIADKLLHGPTVRVKELAGSPGGDAYETALRVLFELDPDTVEAVRRPDDDMLAWSLREATE
ncbi:MAG TPA: glutamyl-tRNA reductase [Streptosporangiaceae bacterium]|nr:glutamyl-tRNA reductase [Streptosporangiaceae bacterium]